MNPWIQTIPETEATGRLKAHYDAGITRSGKVYNIVKIMGLRPEQLRDRDVIHFIDNVGAYSGLGKGYSPDMDSARMISVFHTMNAALRSNVWFEYVPSKANISDLPSRNEFDLLNSSEYEAEAFELVWPPLSAWAGEYGALFSLYAGVRKKRSRKRASPA